MLSREHIRQSFSAALPIMLGYVAIGIPCGILSASIGLDALQVFLFSALFYSGAGQFMIPNMFLAGSSIASIVASVSLVNTRQMLYAASFAPRCEGVRKRLAFLFSATVTDESYGVNTGRFEQGGWSVERATAVNLFSQSSWALSNVAGVLVGNAVGVPLAIASFAMTSIFICLLCTQKVSVENGVAVAVAMAGVYLCKLVGLSGPAILVGALAGVAAAFAVSSARRGPTKGGASDAVRATEGGASWEGTPLDARVHEAERSGHACSTDLGGGARCVGPRGPGFAVGEREGAGVAASAPSDASAVATTGAAPAEEVRP